MRKLGALLLGGGLGLGLLVGLGLLIGIRIGDEPWMVRVGLVKLTLLAAVGLIAVGAFLQRLSKRAARARERSLADTGR